MRNDEAARQDRPATTEYIAHGTVAQAAVGSAMDDRERRVIAPALQIILTLEGVPRVGLVAATYGDQLRIAEWLRAHPTWLQAVETLAGGPLDLLAAAPTGKLRRAA